MTMMTLTTIELPFGEDALAPHISKDTVYTHYAKHYLGYVDKVNKKLEMEADKQGEGQKDVTSEEAIRAIQASPELKGILNAALQVWNHEMYWKSLSPSGGGAPPAVIAKLIDQSFGGLDEFYEAFVKKAGGHFGSGWVWLVESDGQLDILDTHDALNPMFSKGKVLSCCDVWEHAFYLDYKNEKKKYAETFVKKLVNWDFALSQLSA